MKSGEEDADDVWRELEVDFGSTSFFERKIFVKPKSNPKMRFFEHFLHDLEFVLSSGVVSNEIADAYVDVFALAVPACDV